MIEFIGDGALRATSSVEVLQEFALVRGRRRGRAEAAARNAGAHALVSADRSFAALGQAPRHLDPGQPGFDAALAAVAG